jgi:predicted Zn-dependent protease
MYIACPKCDWHPSPDDRWECTCGHRWHTFDTHGVCPACGTVWTVTRCSATHGCGELSDHEEWYHNENELTVDEFLADPSSARRSPSAARVPPASPLLEQATQNVLGRLELLLKKMLAAYTALDERDKADLTRMNAQLDQPRPTDGNLTVIVPFGVVPPEVLSAALDALESTFIHPVEVRYPIAPPATAYNAQREQYRASELLDALKTYAVPGIFRVIGLINEDIYQAGTNFVFGTHWPNSRLIVIGVARFFNPAALPGEPVHDALNRRVASTVISQMAGSLGLGRCATPGCARNPSNSLQDTDQKSAWLCPTCAAQIADWLKPSAKSHTRPEIGL